MFFTLGLLKIKNVKLASKSILLFMLGANKSLCSALGILYSGGNLIINKEEATKIKLEQVT